jgi:cytochrome P450
MGNNSGEPRQPGKDSMRITTPSAGSRVRLDQIDLASTDLYVSGDAHLVWQTLRAERPVFWQQRDDDEGFWAVTRWADVRRVLAEHQTFSSEGGTAISMLGGPDPAAKLMMHSTDPPRHTQFREQIRQSYSAHGVAKYKQQIRSIAREAIYPALDGGVWDIADAFRRMPMAVAAMLMELPEADIDQLLRLAYAALAPLDTRYGDGTPEAAFVAHFEIIGYFTKLIAKRRNSSSTDVIGTLISMEVGGSRLTDPEIVLNCLSLLLGAVVTTSQAISALIIALAERNGGEGRWSRSASVRAAVEESLRWSSPVTHFMRRARRDIELHGESIRANDAITAWIASANRDEAVFERPFTLDLERSPNRHMAFGSGPHLCLGSHLARLMLQESFEELIATIESFELAGAPRHLVSNEIAGVVSLPLRLRLRSSAPAAS